MRLVLASFPCKGESIRLSFPCRREGVDILPQCSLKVGTDSVSPGRGTPLCPFSLGRDAAAFFALPLSGQVVGSWLSFLGRELGCHAFPGEDGQQSFLTMCLNFADLFPLIFPSGKWTIVPQWVVTVPQASQPEF